MWVFIRKSKRKCILNILSIGVSENANRLLSRGCLSVKNIKLLYQISFKLYPTQYFSMRIWEGPFLIFLLFGGQRSYVRSDEYHMYDGGDYLDYEYGDYCDVTVSVEKDQRCKMDDLEQLDDLNATMIPLCCPDGQHGFLHNYDCEVNLSLCHTQIFMEN